MTALTTRAHIEKQFIVSGHCDLDNPDTIITYSNKLIYAGKWEIGLYDRIQAYANRVDKPVDVRSPHGTFLCSIMPETEVQP